MTKINFNGKFLSAKPTGVHRVAEELLIAYGRLVQDDPQLARYAQSEVLVPKSATRELDGSPFSHRTVGQLTWQFWEQFNLPFYARKNLLISFCNLAPIRFSRAITMIHDAQVFITPESYSLPFRKWYQFALPSIGRSNAKILTVSEYSKTQLADWQVAPAEKIEVIHNGVDHILSSQSDDTVLDRLGLTPNTFSVGLANTQAHKNLQVAIKAHQRPELRNRKLVLFGGAKREDFEALGLDVPPNVIFAGFVDDAELKSLMTHAFAIVFPSLTEGFGLPPLEAMLLGTPAICAPCGALPEVCGASATYVDPEDSEAWAHAIDSLANETDAARSERADDAKKHAATFTWDAAARRLSDIIVDCVETLERQQK